MKASELIKKLEEQKEKYGDLEVLIYPGITDIDVFNGSEDYTFNPIFGNIDSWEDYIVIDRVD